MKKNVLLVEDEEINVFLMNEYLSRYDINLFFAKNCEEFYNIFNDKNNKIDLILMDYRLPDGNGYELSKYIINEKLNIPIIFISAYIDKSNEIYNLGIKWFLTKPISYDKLILCMNNYVQMNKKV